VLAPNSPHRAAAVAFATASAAPAADVEKARPDIFLSAKANQPAKQPEFER
jgi:hypothetical protein